MLGRAVAQVELFGVVSMMGKCVNPVLKSWSTGLNKYGRRYPTDDPERGDTNRPVMVKCGKCIGCRASQSLDWCVRAYHESLCHERNSFLTLTVEGEAEPVLSRKVVQDFNKRLRRGDGSTRGKPVDFRFLACGEHGGIFGRAHYHMLVFGEDFREGARYLYGDRREYESPYLQRKWGLGFVKVLSLEPGSAFYVGGDALKNFGGESFLLYSKNPFLGAAWAYAFYDDLVRNNFCTIEGTKYPVPKAYLRRPELRTQFAPLKAERLAHAESITFADAAEAVRTAPSREMNLLALSKRRRGQS